MINITNTTDTTALNHTAIITKVPKVNVEGIVVIFCSAIMCLLGLLGNSIVLTISLKRRRKRTPTNWFLINLTISNLAIVIITIPMNVVLTHISWPFGDYGCQYFVMPVMEHFASVCVLTHTAISLARYLVVCKNGQTIMKVGLIKLCIALIWICSFLVVSATLMGGLAKFEYFPGNDTNREHCKIRWLSPSNRYIYRISIFILTYCIPISISGFSYYKTYRIVSASLRDVSQHLPTHLLSIRRRTNRRMLTMFMTMYGMFCFTTLPLQIFMVCADFKLIPYFKGIGTLFDFNLLLFYAQVITNPFVLFYMGREYQLRLKNIFRYCYLRCIGRRRDLSVYKRRDKTSFQMDSSFRDYSGRRAPKMSMISLVSIQTTVSALSLKRKKSSRLESPMISRRASPSPQLPRRKQGLVAFKYDDQEIKTIDRKNGNDIETLI